LSFGSHVIVFQILASHDTFPRRDMTNKSPEGRIRAGIYYSGKPSDEVVQQTDRRRQLSLPTTRGFTQHQERGRGEKREKKRSKTMSFDGYNELQVRTDTDPKVSVSDLVGHVLSPDTYHAYAIYLCEEMYVPP